MKNFIARTDIYIEKCGLYIPNSAVNYEDFKAKIADSELRLKNQIKKLYETY